MTLDNIIKFAQAVKEGKTLQQQIASEWYDWLEPKEDTSWTDKKDCDIRIKPTITKRLITIDELPLLCWIREIHNTSKRLITDRHDKTIGTGNCGYFELSWLREKNWQWSATCRPDDWHSFEVEEIS